MRNIAIAFSVITLLFSSCKTDPPLFPMEQTCNNAAPLYDTVVLLAMGQSNAANAGNVLYSSYYETTFNFFEGNLYPLNDPLKGANGTGGSVWSRLGDKIIQCNFAKTVIVVPCAVGGTRIEQWIPGGDLNHLIAETKHYLDSAGLKVTHVLWHQGESNHVLYSGGLTAEQNASNYTSNFILLVQYLRGIGIDAPVYPAMATRCIGEPDIVLQEAQRNLANDSLRIFNGPNTDLLDNNYRYDNCHFNLEGLNLHAAMWLNALFE